MAENATLGRLFVDLLLRDEQFQKGLKGSERALRASGKQFDAYAKTISTGLVTAFKAATAASAGLLAASAAVGAGFEKQMDAVAAVRGITSETSGEFMALEAQARSLGATTAFSATEAAQGMEALARAGLQTNEIIAASEVALKLAGAGQIELGRSAEILAGTMAQFGLSAQETTRIADVFTVATQNTLFGTEDLAQAMKYAGTVGAAFGKEIEETTAAVAQFRNLGLEGTMAGTQFRMMMAAAAKPTEEAEAALAKYGLTIENINPETQSFADILKNVGQAGVSTADSLAIFGTRAGANVAALSKKFAESTDDFDTLLATLKQAGQEGTATADTYARMTDNVVGRLAQLRSVTEETMLLLFERFRQPLTDLLSALVDFMSAVAAELGARGAEIGGNFEDIFGQIREFIVSNTATGAKAVADFIVSMQSLAQAMIPIVLGLGQMLAALSPLVPLLDDMAILFATIFAAQKAAALASFVAGLWSMVTAAGGATAALSAMGTALVAATGGVAAITTAIGVLIAGLAILIKRNRDAADSTRELQSVQEQVSERESVLAGHYRFRAQERLTLTKEQILAEREAAGSSEALSESRRKEIDTLLGLSDATAAQKLRTGELIEVGDGLRTVEGLLASGADGFRVVNDEIEKTQGILKGYEERTQSADAATREFSEKRVREVQERLFTLRAAIVDAKTATERQSAAQNELVGLLGEVSTESGNAETATDSLAESQMRFADALAVRMRDLRDELRAIGLSDSEAEAERLRKKKAEIERFFDEQIALEEAQGDRLAELRQQRADALALVDEIGARESEQGRTEIEAEAVAKLQSLRLEEASEAERIAAERDRVLADLAGASAETRAAIAEEYARRIAEAEKAATPEDLEEKTVGPLGQVAEAFGKAGKAAIAFGNAVVSGTAQAFDALAGVVEQISGFGGLDLGAIADDALSEVTDAAEEARKKAEEAALAAGQTPEQAAQAGEEAALAIREGFDLTGAAIGFVDTLISEAIARAEALAEIVGPVLARLAEAIPSLLQTVAEALPVLALALAEQIPIVIQAVVDNLEPLILALIDAAQTLIVSLIEALPSLVESVLAMIPTVITRLAEAIPVVLDAVVAALPLIIDSLIASIAPILTAVIDAIPVIVLALVESIPFIVTSLLNAIPLIVAEVLAMVPHLISTLIGMLPEVVESLAEQLPSLIAAVVALLPTLITTIIAALPQIAMALLEAIFVELIPMLPKMVAQLFVAIVDGMGQALRKIAEGIWNAIKGFFSIFKKKGDKEEKGKRGAFSGMDYVPATMRMTVHRGEAIIPADRNAAIASGEIAPAPAGAAQNGAGSFGGGGSERPIDIAVMAEGRLLDAVQIIASKRGHATGVVKEIRRAGGVRVGLSRGRFSAFSSR